MDTCTRARSATGSGQDTLWGDFDLVSASLLTADNTRELCIQSCEGWGQQVGEGGGRLGLFLGLHDHPEA